MPHYLFPLKCDHAMFFQKQLNSTRCKIIKIKPALDWHQLLCFKHDVSALQHDFPSSCKTGILFWLKLIIYCIWHQDLHNKTKGAAQVFFKNLIFLHSNQFKMTLMYVEKKKNQKIYFLDQADKTSLETYKTINIDIITCLFRRISPSEGILPDSLQS